MPRAIALDHFSLIEVKRRLKHAKEYLQRYKTQRLLFCAPKDHLLLPVIELNEYNCYDEYNFINSVDLSEDLIRDCVNQNRELFVDESGFVRFNVFDYANEYYDVLKRLFSVTCFCLLDKDMNVDCKVIICLGSLHHAPRIFYRDARNRFSFDKLMMYDDLQ
jgi:hypothetical protein